MKGWECLWRFQNDERRRSFKDYSPVLDVQWPHSIWCQNNSPTQTSSVHLEELKKGGFIGPAKKKLLICLKLGVIHTLIWQKTNKIAPVENDFTKYMLRSYWMKNIHLRLGRVYWWLVPVNGECNIVETVSLIRAVCQTVTCWAVHYQISSTLQKTLSLPNPIL